MRTADLCLAGGGKIGVHQSERIDYAGGDLLRGRASCDLLDEHPEQNVVRVRIDSLVFGCRAGWKRHRDIDQFSGGEVLRWLCACPHQQLAGLDVFRPCSAGGEVVRQSTGVLQEISNGDSVAVVPVAYDRSGQVMLDAHIEVEQSVVDELHDDGRDEGLCVAADSDPRIIGDSSPVAVFPIPARMMRVPRDGSEITSCAPGIPCLMTPSSAVARQRRFAEWNQWSQWCHHIRSRPI